MGDFADDVDQQVGDLDCPPAGAATSNNADTSKPRRAPTQPPQDTVDQFWGKFNTKYPGKVSTVLPSNPYARSKAAKIPQGVVSGQNAARSYDEARAECIRDVDRIVRECRRLNQRYRDPHFDIEFDLKTNKRDCLNGLTNSDGGMRPKGVLRVTDIFEDPQFYVNGPTAGDVRQGRDGDCWLMAALCTLGNKEGLIDKVCVARDQPVGVYGFVFHRDGEWQQVIIDDKLYLRAPDYDESVEERQVWDDINRIDTEEEYRKAYQTGSRALYFAQCSDENETWLPLLEKAYAKAHGDYLSIDGGFVGEAIEDLTGGVTTELFSTDILDKDKFWREELMHVNKDFLFGCATGFFSNWLNPNYDGPPKERRGIAEGHAYSIMDAREIKGQRLLKVRNPWGKKEWTGAWSDGSEEWTPEWMQLLGHKFGNDGMFWISYKDLLRKYQHFDRTRLFGPDWRVTQQWTSLSVPWSADYHSTKFQLTVKNGGPVVIVLSQLDDRYFLGLEGQYSFSLQFRLERDGDTEDDYVVRSPGSYIMARSVSTDIELEPGFYSVLIKLTAIRDAASEPAEEVIRKCAKTRREKLVQIGLSYDLAHAKGRIVESDQEREEREEREEQKRKAARRKLRDEAEARERRRWELEKKRRAREKRKRAKSEKLRAERSSAAAEQAESDASSGSAAAGSLPDNKVPAEEMDNPTERNGNVTFQDSVTESPTADVVRPLEEVVKVAEQGPGAQDTVPAIQINGLDAVKDVKPIGGLLPAEAEDRISDTDSVSEFEFDSELDMPPEDSDTEEPKPPSPSSSDKPTGDGDDDDDESNPWNAVCVVGLRVYSKDDELGLEVVRPKNDNDAEAPLDRDDPSKGPSGVQNGQQAETT